MSNLEALSSITNMERRLEKKRIKSTIEQYKKYHDCYGGNEEMRKANAGDMVHGIWLG
ncbi:putative Cycloartenol-C-24-methyltransferase 1 [Cocos nucifera]|nr:putative Cycloartenol-C-24-methyltransferase 1 [Cocos nucifera]